MPANIDEAYLKENSYEIKLADAEEYVCQCGIKDSNLEKWTDANQRAEIEKGRKDGEAIILPKCKNYIKMMENNAKSSGSDFEKATKLFGAIEKLFHCTGIC